MKTQHLVHTGQSTEDASTLSPFGQFVAALLKHQPRPHVIAANNVIWGGWPIELMLIHGFWIVFRKAAAKLGIRLSTEHDVLNAIAPRIDRVLNAALILGYESPEAAAVDFEQQVYPAIRSGLKKHMAGSPVHPAQLWQIPVAEFLAGLIRLAAAKGHEVYRTNQQLVALNCSGSGIVLSRYAPTQEGSIAFILPLFLDPKDCPPHLGERLLNEDLIPGTDVDAAQKFLANAPALTRKLELLRRLPMHLPRIIKDRPVRGDLLRDIERTWINTQILCAASSRRLDGDILTRTEYLAGIRALRQITAEEATAAFMARMASRGLNLETQADQTLLRDLALASATYLRNGTGEVIGPSIREDVFIQIDDDEIDIGPGFALLAATSPADWVSPHGIVATPKRLAAQINWQGVSLAQFTAMVKHSTIPPELLVRHIEELPVHSRKRAAKRLFDSAGNPEITAYLLENGYLSGSLTEIIGAPRKFPVARRILAVRHLLNDPASYNDEYLVERASELFKALPNNREVRTLLQDPLLRYPLSIVVYTLASKYDVSLATVRCFASLFDPDYWTNLVFSVEIGVREEEYQEPTRDPGFGDRIKPWQDMLPEGAHFLNGITPRKSFRHLLEAHPEDQVFAWLYEADSDLPKKLKDFQSARERYYSQAGTKKGRFRNRRKKPSK